MGFENMFGFDLILILILFLIFSIVSMDLECFHELYFYSFNCTRLVMKWALMLGLRIGSRRNSVYMVVLLHRFILCSNFVEVPIMLSL